MKELDTDRKLVRVEFLEQVGSGNLFAWPSQPDSSWEPETFVRGSPVTMHLDEAKSTRTRQYLSVSEI